MKKLILLRSRVYIDNFHFRFFKFVLICSIVVMGGFATNANAEAEVQLSVLNKEQDFTGSSNLKNVEGASDTSASGKGHPSQFQKCEKPALPPWPLQPLSTAERVARFKFFLSGKKLSLLPKSKKPELCKNILTKWIGDARIGQTKNYKLLKPHFIKPYGGKIPGSQTCKSFDNIRLYQNKDFSTDINLDAQFAGLSTEKKREIAPYYNFATANI